MSFWSFGGKLYIWGGSIKGRKVAQDGVLQIDPADGRVLSVKIAGLQPRKVHSTVEIPEESHKVSVIFLGGFDENPNFSSTVQTFQIIDNRFTLLHYLDATGLNRLLGTNQC